LPLSEEWRLKFVVGRARSHGGVLQTVDRETVFFLKPIFSRSATRRKCLFKYFAADYQKLKQRFQVSGVETDDEPPMLRNSTQLFEAFKCLSFWQKSERRRTLDCCYWQLSLRRNSTNSSRQTLTRTENLPDVVIKFFAGQWNPTVGLQRTNVRQRVKHGWTLLGTTG